MVFNFWLINALTWRDQRLKGIGYGVVRGFGVVANIGIAQMLYEQNGAWRLIGAIIGVV